jgi:hypothetical protein
MHDTKASWQKISAQKNQQGKVSAVNKGKESLVITKKIAAIFAVLGVSITGALVSSPAISEPVANSFAIVGSDTLEDAVNGLVNGSNRSGANIRTTAGGISLGSFDATGTPCIITKPNGIRFGRPNGSGAGRTALSRSIDGAPYTSNTLTCPDNTSRIITGQVDIARSSSSGTTNAAGTLIQVPFGRDAIAYAYHSGSTATGIASLTKAQLETIFKCDFVPEAGQPNIIPVVPQSGSGTRSDWLGKLGILEANLETVAKGGCVIEGQEHDGTSLTAANMVMPMSASRWVAMNTGATVAKIGSAVIAGIADVAAAPVINSGVTMEPNPTYYSNSTWGRDTYLVVEFARVDITNTAKYDPFLAAVMDPSIINSLTNTSDLARSRSGSLKKKYGFLAPASSTAQRINAS